MTAVSIKTVQHYYKEDNDDDDDDEGDVTVLHGIDVLNRCDRSLSVTIGKLL
jgi:hypothetical protein